MCAMGGGGGGGLQHGKFAGLKLFAPLSRQGKTCCGPPSKGWKIVASQPRLAFPISKLPVSLSNWKFPLGQFEELAIILYAKQTKKEKYETSQQIYILYQ